MLSRLDLKTLLLVLTLVYAVTFTISTAAKIAGAAALLSANTAYVGADFINMWSAARLVLERNFSAIYDPEAFMAFQKSFLPADIGLRLWAYPPHSLLFLWPLGFFSYYPALVLWSVIGLALLFWGARRFGFDAIETAIIMLSPASLACLYFGQTGNAAAGLLLLALSARSPEDRTLRDKTPIVAAALLTIKPQAGFLLPVLWVVQRRWMAIFWTGVLAVAICLLSIGVFGWDAWRGYLFQTLPVLDELERHGTGPFMLMIPSAFMAFRIVLGDGSLAATLHLIFAAGVVAYLIWRLVKVHDATARNALILIGTVLITPYMHTYDLGLLLCGALLVARLHPEKFGVFVLVAIAWVLPHLVMWLNALNVPLSPLLILPLLVLAGRMPEHAQATPRSC
jgi:alpha-1,2-mannosyltransferase